MSFTKNTFAPLSTGGYATKVPAPRASYTNLNDTLATIMGSGYFNAVGDLFKLSDLLFVTGSDQSQLLQVTGLNPVTTALLAPLTGTHVTTWRGIWEDNQPSNVSYGLMGKKAGLVFTSLFEAGDGLNSDIISMNGLLPVFLRPSAPVIVPRLVRLGEESDAFGTLFIDVSGIVSFSAGAGVSVPFSPTAESTGFYGTHVEYETA